MTTIIIPAKSIVTCDRCNKTGEPYKEESPFENKKTRIQITTSTSLGKLVCQEFDLCEECLDALYLWVNSKP